MAEIGRVSPIGRLRMFVRGSPPRGHSFFGSNKHTNRQTCFCDPIFSGIGMVYLKVMSRNEWKAMNEKANLEISYGFGMSPFGKCLIALLDGMICHLSFVTGSKTEMDCLMTLKREWKEVKRFSVGKNTSRLVEEIFEMKSDSFEVMVRCTEFEEKIWKALLSVPPGRVVTYSELGEKAGEGQKARAVGNAVGRNPVAFLIPCHRVINKNGRIHKYKWGSEIKEKILRFENKHFTQR